MKINKYILSDTDKEIKKDYVDRHSAFIHCEAEAKAGEKFKVKVQVGKEYKHPDVPDHYIAWVQLWNREKMLAQTYFIEGAFANEPANAEVDFFIVPKKNMKLTAQAFCSKHGLWQSDEVEVTVK